MFRPLTVVAITAFSLVGWHVYRAEDAAEKLDREFRTISRQIETAKERTQVLRAEWAMLNEPDRLRQVARSHLPLENMTPTQFLRMADLEKRLPAPVAFAGPVDLFGPAPEVAIAAAAPDMAPQVTSVATTLPVAQAAPPIPASRSAPVSQPVAVATTEAAPRPAPRSATMAASRPEARIEPRPESRPEPRRVVAEPAAPAAVLPVARPLRPAGPMMADAPMRNEGRLLRTAAAQLPMGRAMAAPPQASALGYGGSTLAPPVPLGRPVPVVSGNWNR
jgi:hypothetical protein